MPSHFIAIDAGGSKTKAAIREIKTAKTIELSAGPASLSHDLELACQTIGKLIEQLLIEAEVTRDQCVLVCGAAGAGCVNNANALDEHVGQFAEKLITTDGTTSLYGAGQGEAIIVVATGTGSVAMKLDKLGNLSTVGGWGFIAGDLGSGAAIGRQIIVKVLNEFDQKTSTTDPIIAEVLNQIGYDRQSILDWLKVATASSYAKFAPVAFAGYMRSELAKQIIDKAARDIEQLVACYANDGQLPVAIVGGLSAQITLHLSEVLQSRLIQPKGGAIDGAFYLANQLIKEKTHG